MVFAALAASLIGLEPESSSEPGPTARVEVSQWRGMDALLLATPSVEAVIVPQIGRVMAIREPGKAGGLYAPREVEDVSGWRNWGGDKLWPAPQSSWVWPPDPALDGSRHEADLIPGGIRLTSPVSPTTGLQVSRLIRLETRRPRIHFLNIVTNMGRIPQRVSPWQVVQVARPETLSLELGRTEWKELRLAILNSQRSVGDRIRVSGERADLPVVGWGYKAVSGGRFAEALLAADGSIIRLASFEPRRPGPASSEAEGVWSKEELALGSIGMAGDSGLADFPDSGGAVQAFMDPKGAYGELEATGRLQTLTPGESACLATALTIIPHP